MGYYCLLVGTVLTRPLTYFHATYNFFRDILTSLYFYNFSMWERQWLDFIVVSFELPCLCLQRSAYIVACVQNTKSERETWVKENTRERHVTFVKNHASNCTKIRSWQTVSVKWLDSYLLRHRNIYLVFWYLVEELYLFLQ